MHLLSRPRRRRARPGEWTADKAVTFIVSLAARGSVTLAARASGMSRKSVYALKARDPAFASAWAAAVNAAAGPSAEGNKVEEVKGPPNRSRHGHTSPSPSERAPTFADLIAALRQSPPLAPRRTAP